MHNFGVSAVLIAINNWINFFLAANKIEMAYPLIFSRGPW